MYLKALEIQGFKSFPDKTLLTFEKDITAIVGPNGSGKSNISDAIMWVMGEQRSKALRGGKMEDVIFGGTEKRSQMGFAQVTLILDNADHIFDTDSSEVMITRRCYRSGESEYYINRQSVKLRNIHELLMDTGLGRDGYSIIGQGRIAEIVSAKSGDRREIFEEAAGISRFRYRKEESERKLAKTDENLLRINDKIDELELQVGPLRQQAEVAKRYLILRDELRVEEVSLWMENLDRLQEQSAKVNADYDGAREAIDLARTELEELYRQSENFSAKMREKDVEADSVRETLSQTESAAAECESAAAVLRANLRSNNENIDRIRAELTEQRTQAHALEEQIAQRRKRREELVGIMDEHRREESAILAQSAENTAGTDALQKKVSGLVLRETETVDALSAGRTALSLLAENAQELMDREEANAAEHTAVSEKETEARATLADARKAHSEAKEKAQELANVTAGYRLRLNGREARVRELSDRQTRCTIDLKNMDSRIHMLAEMEKEYEGFNKAVKTVMREAERGAIRGVHGPIASLVKTDDRFAVAVETALGSAMQHIVVDRQEDGKAAIEMLKRRDAGRATFRPIDAVRGNVLKNVPRDEQGCLGLALELVQFDKAYAEIFADLLGRTVITETLSDAVRISKKYGNQYRIVSLDGQVMNVGGSMTGGSSSAKTGMLSRANELKRLREQRVKAAEALDAVTAELTEANRELAAVKYELEVATTELAAANEAVVKREGEVTVARQLVSAIEDKLDELEEEKRTLAKRVQDTDRRVAETRENIAGLERELEAIRAELAGLSEGRQDLERRREELSAALSELRAKEASSQTEMDEIDRSVLELGGIMADISAGGGSKQEAIDEFTRRNTELQSELTEKEARLHELYARAESLKTRIASIAETKLQLEGRRTQAEKAAQEKNRDLLELERVAARCEQKKVAADMEEKQLVDKLWDTYELSHSAAQTVRQPVESVQKTARRVSELKREINSLGNPNLGAIEEYERVSTRYGFLTEQRDDVEKAKKELLGIIADITGEMKEIFVREFTAIDASFRETFVELFGGGKAALVLEDPENVLDCGIEIKVQPPGKALSTLSLMSGGEMAFVAIALYFAILKVRPTPFCVMDEIEAALDEANVTRYAEYMRTMCGKTQFVVITHRRGTMEEADMLYGVTMQEKGVSKVISIDLEEAAKTIEAR